MYGFFDSKGFYCLYWKKEKDTEAQYDCIPQKSFKLYGIPLLGFFLSLKKKYYMTSMFFFFVHIIVNVVIFENSEPKEDYVLMALFLQILIFFALSNIAKFLIEFDLRKKGLKDCLVTFAESSDDAVIKLHRYLLNKPESNRKMSSKVLSKN